MRRESGPQENYEIRTSRKGVSSFESKNAVQKDPFRRTYVKYLGSSSIKGKECSIRLAEQGMCVCLLEYRNIDQSCHITKEDHRGGTDEGHCMRHCLKGNNVVTINSSSESKA